MIRGLKLTASVSFWAVFVLALLLPYQNCTRAVFTGEQKTAMSSGGGNGDGYEGKPMIYSHYSDADPCAIKGAAGNPLPNKEIFYFSKSAIQLVRRDCNDITPENLTEDQVSLSADQTTLVFEGETFVAEPIDDPGFEFKVVAAECPNGMTLKASATRTNLFADPLNLQAGTYQIHEGMQNPPPLEGSLVGLPRFALRRDGGSTGAMLEHWRRVSKLPNITGGVDYAFTFIAEPGTTNHANIQLWQWPGAGGAVVTVHVNLLDGTYYSTTPERFNSFSITSRPFGNGRIITAYFNTQVTYTMDIGVTTKPDLYNGFGNAVLGDSIFATSFQLEEVANFCQ